MKKPPKCEITKLEDEEKIGKTHLVIHKSGIYKSLFDYAKCPSLKIIIAFVFQAAAGT